MNVLLALVVAISDGDTLTVRPDGGERLKVRVAEIDAQEALRISGRAQALVVLIKALAGSDAGATELGVRSSTSERIRLVIDLRSAEQLVRLLAEEGVSAQPEPPPTAWQ